MCSELESSTPDSIAVQRPASPCLLRDFTAAIYQNHRDLPCDWRPIDDLVGENTWHGQMWTGYH